MLKDIDKKPLSISEQKDVDEFYNLLFDQLDMSLQSTSQGSLIQEVFGGSFANEVICVDCPHRSERIEKFLSVNLQILGKKNIEESLNSLVESELMEASNAYYCERCEKKVKAKRRATLKVLPNTMVFILKRFDYNRDTGYDSEITFLEAK